MAAKARLDVELVRRGLARSREHAQQLVSAGQVQVGGLVATKAATGVDASSALTVTDGESARYVSRGALKLAGALDALPAIVVAGRRCLDAGASTGGFTEVLLARGAREVVAVDVGYGQLAWSLRTDSRVAVHERTNVRNLEVDVIGGPVELTVADLSFISLTVVLPALVGCTDDTGDLLVMVKPQFEVGRGEVGRGGVVRDPQTRAGAVRRVAEAAAALGRGTQAVVASPLPGPAGNVEFFLWLRAGAPDPSAEAILEVVAAAP